MLSITIIYDANLESIEVRWRIAKAQTQVDGWMHFQNEKRRQSDIILINSINLYKLSFELNKYCCFACSAYCDRAPDALCLSPVSFAAIKVNLHCEFSENE